MLGEFISMLQMRVLYQCKVKLTTRFKKNVHIVQSEYGMSELLLRIYKLFEYFYSFSRGTRRNFSTRLPTIDTIKERKGAKGAVETFTLYLESPGSFHFCVWEIEIFSWKVNLLRMYIYINCYRNINLYELLEFIEEIKKMAKKSVWKWTIFKVFNF